MTIEARVTVVVASFGRGHCRQCRGAIVWYRTPRGTSMPFTGRPIVRDIKRDLSLPGAPQVGTVPRADLHWFTCPGVHPTRPLRRRPP